MVIVVPFRNRRDQLAAFASHMAQFFDHDVRILVVEQADGKPFNRGALLNVGFDLSRATCATVCFHDVDMLPLNRSCDYSLLPVGMRHLAGAAQQFGYDLPYRNYIGGVLVSTTSAFEEVNGYSNGYWGWGCEDDDLFLRTSVCGVPIQRTPGRYLSLPHERTLRPAINQHRLATLASHVMGWPKPATDEELRRLRRDDHGNFNYAAEARVVFMDDGLSSLRYEVVARTPLANYLGDRRLSAKSHELVTVEV